MRLLCGCYATDAENELVHYVALGQCYLYISHTEFVQGDLYLDWGGDFAEQPGPIMV